MDTHSAESERAAIVAWLRETADLMREGVFKMGTMRAGHGVATLMSVAMSTKRGGQALFRTVTPGRRPERYSIGPHDVWTTGLVIELSTFHKVGNYR